MYKMSLSGVTQLLGVDNASPRHHRLLIKKPNADYVLPLLMLGHWGPIESTNITCYCHCSFLPAEIDSKILFVETRYNWAMGNLGGTKIETSSVPANLPATIRFYAQC